MQAFQLSASGAVLSLLLAVPSVACATTTEPAAVATLETNAAEKNIVETAAAAGNFGTLITAAKAAGLVEALTGKGPLTVFAPTDAAFAKLGDKAIADLLKPENKAKLAAILKLHVVAGDYDAAKVVERATLDTLNGQRIDIAKQEKSVTIDGAGLVATDIVASNGRIHVIDTVLLPETNTIVDAANEAGSFTTLLAAVKAAGLAETLMGEGPFTVFAPTDAAFAELGDATIQSLLEKENRDKLKAILTYHVVPGRVYADQAIAAKSATTLAGGALSIRQADGKVMINGATVVAADLDLANGVIHVIDAVLLPESS